MFIFFCFFLFFLCDLLAFRDGGFTSCTLETLGMPLLICYSVNIGMGEGWERDVRVFGYLRLRQVWYQSICCSPRKGHAILYSICHNTRDDICR